MLMRFRWSRTALEATSSRMRLNRAASSHIGFVHRADRFLTITVHGS